MKYYFPIYQKQSNKHNKYLCVLSFSFILWKVYEFYRNFFRFFIEIFYLFYCMCLKAGFQYANYREHLKVFHDVHHSVECNDQWFCQCVLGLIIPVQQYILIWVRNPLMQSYLCEITFTRNSCSLIIMKFPSSSDGSFYLTREQWHCKKFMLPWSSSDMDIVNRA